MSAKPPKGPDRGSTDVLRLGKLLVGLHATPDGDLTAFRDKRCQKAGKVDVVNLRRARDLLDALAEALESPDPALWRRLEAGWRIIVDEVSETKAQADLEKAEADAKPAPKPRMEVRRPEAKPRVAPPPPETPAAGSMSSAPNLAAPPLVSAWSQSPWARSTDVDTPPAMAKSTAGHEPTPAPGVAETQAIDKSRIKVPQLPFKAAAPAAQVSNPPTGSSVATPPKSEGKRQPGGAGLEETADVSSLKRGMVLPFGTAQASSPAKSVPPSPVELSVEQFASLCAACEVEPDKVFEHERRFGIHRPEVRSAIDTHWRERMGSDEALRNLYRERFQEYRSWLLAHRGQTPNKGR